MKTILLALFLVLNGAMLFAQDKQIADNFQRTELYFGRNMAQHKKVTNRDWKKFVADHIVPQLGGFTVLDADGGYLNNSGKLKTEQSKVLIIIHVNSADYDAKIERIREAYKTRFNQNSVMRVDALVKMEE